ncbi:MAG TPA: OmpA family protein, partial [Polyangiaceae bacterium]|nr:OmpA family protein [Polyangiaceae bacterium]
GHVPIRHRILALPRMGNIVGRVMDAATSSGVANASVVVTDAQGKEHRVTTDGSGNFRLDGVVPGAVKVQTEAEKYLLSTESANVEPRKDAQVNINLNARPKQSNVVVTQTQIIIRKQINFETDSAVIKGDSTSLMQEIADVIARNPSIKLVEVQGHTDNTGTREHNQELSERRANAVKDWLVANGIEASRLEATGYGQTRPIAPNVTAANRAKNRRVQFVIKERQ